MGNPVIVKNTYVPKVGEGRALLAALAEAATVWESAGFPGLELWRVYHGPHNAIATIQRWPSIAEYDEARARVVDVPELVSVVFDRIYPTNAAAYETEIFEVVG